MVLKKHMYKMDVHDFWWIVTVAVLIKSVVAVQETLNTDLKLPCVKFSDGTVEGHVVNSAQRIPVQEYRGIPYGQPPIGDLRYADPEPVKPWSDVKITREYGASCHQLHDLTFGDFHGSAMWNAPNEMSEDCLYLNVWTPHPRPKNAAVLVWIFGGGFYSGTTALAVYDGKSLTAHSNVIVVSMNYRVGSLGFLATGDGRIHGNFGLKDQQLSLKWVQQNIAQFGGNPDSVTIMGESAGASSVGYHMMSPGSADLFHRGIMQSGSPGAHWAFMSKDQAKQRSKKLFEAFNCANDDDVLKCLRDPSLTPTYIVNNEWVVVDFLVFPWAPTVDGSFLLDSPLNLIKNSNIKKTDLILGTNKDEGTFWILYSVSTYSKDTDSHQTWEDTLKAIEITENDLSPQTKQEMIKLYMEGKGTSNTIYNRDVIDDIVGDRSFVCPTMEFANANMEHGATYVYRLNHRASNEVWPNWMGVIHGADIQYVFGIPLNKSLGYSLNDVALAKEVMTYWGNFAKYGSPNGNGEGSNMLYWPIYDSEESHIDFMPGSKSAVKEEVRVSYCDFWSIVEGMNKQK